MALVKGPILKEFGKAFNSTIKSIMQEVYSLYAGETQCHVAHPISYRGDVLAVLSLQWDTPYCTLDDVTQLLNLMAPLLASSIKTSSL